MIRKFGAYFYFTGWTHISLGVHLSLNPLNIEIHLPFGFCRVGIIKIADSSITTIINGDYCDKRTFGYDPQRYV